LVGVIVDFYDIVSVKEVDESVGSMLNTGIVKEVGFVDERRGRGSVGYAILLGRLLVGRTHRGSIALGLVVACACIFFVFLKVGRFFLYQLNTQTVLGVQT
jgi:hypothetical protein